MYIGSNLCCVDNRVLTNKDMVANMKREEGNTEKEEMKE